MKLNEHTQIIGTKAILVPYEERHVEKYHNWMLNEELRRLTGSELLSLEEEYEMQQTWRNDEDKLTFIVLAKDVEDSANDEIISMVGDVNMFINEEKEGELEVMIAESSARGKGIAIEALKLIAGYALTHLDIERVFVKVTDDNAHSLHLFQDKLGFEKTSHSSVFKEFTLYCPVDNHHIFTDAIEQADVCDYNK